MIVGLLHPGEMGAAVGAVLVAGGHEVRWLPEGRSEATARRAAAFVGVDSLEGCDVVLSICPPTAALAVARSAPADALLADLNAVSPLTARAIGEVRGGRWVDGGIVGPPPVRAGTTRIYLSGPHARVVAGLFTGTLAEPVVLDGDVSASALKMTYAAWTKGTAALLLAIDATADACGVRDALHAEWERSLPQLAERLRGAQASAQSKGWRWVGEMEEIAATFDAAGQPPGFHLAAADVFKQAPRRLPR